MCGIAGFFGSRTLDRGHLERLTRALSHRGPDGEGFHLEPRHGCGLGHRRLAILDPSARGAQPMTIEGTDAWIVLNGEIYNFLELRRELEGHGHRFRTDTDTEVALAAWLHWGDAAFARWNGMWAVALLDGKRGVLTLCRDRYGVKPLFYREDRDDAGLLFASEMKSFWALAPELGTTWDLRGLRTALARNHDLESSPRSLVAGVHKLLPGHLLTASAEGVRVRRWWSTLEHLVDAPRTLDEQAEALRAILTDAVRVRMRSDVPIGATLSGGVDSGSVVSVMGALAREDAAGERAASDNRRAFTHRFAGSAFDESDLATLVARDAGATLRLVDMSPEDLLATVDRVITDCGLVPRMLPDNWWRIYRAHRAERVVVSLDGHGSDELFGGYGHHHRAAGERPTLRERGRQLARQAVRAALAPSARILSDEGRAVAPYAGAPAPVLPSHFGPLQRALYLDFHHAILPGILRDFDAVSMAHGVEVRSPFLDYRLVSLAFSLPPSSLVAGGTGKLVLRRAMRGLVPDAVILRQRKVPFIGPHARWIQTLRPWIRETLAGTSAIDGLVARDRLRAYHARRDAGWTRPDEVEDRIFLRTIAALRLCSMSPAELSGGRPG